ncbi:MAG: Rrf2 family transcriptional regulator [Phycisphaerae bacterium]|nr:Rrf2 family transcriptional regulator [Phycisphaerae bacterium]
MLRRKTATYALLALYEIADQHRDTAHPTGVRAHDIAHKHKLPKAYVAKILSQLANAEILHSDRGPRGGFRLNHSPKDISLYDIFDGVGALTTNDKRRPAVKGLPQPVQATMAHTQDEAADLMKGLFLKTTLADVLAGVLAK